MTSPNPKEISLGRLLNTNDPPSDIEMAAIRQALLPTAHELEAIDNELKQLADHETRLMARRHLLLHQTHLLRSIASPIRIIPEDVLQEIFLLCLPEDQYPTFDLFTAPLLLTHICRRWRHIAHRTGALWTRIHISIPTLLPVHSSQSSTFISRTSLDVIHARFQAVGCAFVRAIEGWVSRARGCKLSLSLWQQDHRQAAEDNVCSAIIDTLLQYSTSWEQADVKAPLRTMGALISRPPTAFPVIRQLSIFCTSRSALPLPHAPHAAVFPSLRTTVGQRTLFWKEAGILRSPTLESLHFSRIDESIATFPLRWEALTSLSIEEQGTALHVLHADWHPNIVIDVPVTVVILRRCINLENFRISLTPGAMVPANNHPDLSTPLITPSLRTLSFHEGYSSAMRFFELLDAPSIKTLEFQTRRIPDGQSTLSIIPFIRRDGHSLEELIIDTRFISLSDRPRVFEHLVNLKSLALRRLSTFSSLDGPNPGTHGDDVDHIPFTCYDLRMFFQSTMDNSCTPMQPRTRSFVYCPQLQTLKCETLSTISDSDLVQFIAARKPLGLKHVKVTCFTTREDQIWLAQKLNEYARDGDGMLLEISYEMKPKFVST